jgi:hypothetical protein
MEACRTSIPRGRLRTIFDVVLFGADQLAVAWLKDDDVGSGNDGLRILADVEDFDIHLRPARREERIKADALIRSADENGPRADRVIRGGELALRVAFDGREKRHARGGAEEIDVRVRNWFAGGAIDDRAVNGSGERYGGGEKCGESGGK